MVARVSWTRSNRYCVKCRAPTQRVGFDPVTGTVGIPLCQKCAGSDVHRLVLLAVTLCVVACGIF